MIEENIEMQRLNIKTRCGSNPTFTTKKATHESVHIM